MASCKPKKWRGRDELPCGLPFGCAVVSDLTPEWEHRQRPQVATGSAGTAPGPFVGRMMVNMQSQHSASFRTREGATSLWVIAHESVAGFLRNGGFRSASSLAFYTALALVPSLLLLTCVLSLGIGYSQTAMLRTEAFVTSVLPRFAEVILAELSRIARDRAAAGLIDVVVLPLSLLPLVAAMRSSISSIFKVYSHHPLWLTKVIDLVTALIFVTGVAAVASLGVVSEVLRAGSAGAHYPAGLD